jgi:hypothetical protein
MYCTVSKIDPAMQANKWTPKRADANHNYSLSSTKAPMVAMRAAKCGLTEAAAAAA